MNHAISSRMYAHKLPRFLRKNFIFNFLDRILGINRLNQEYLKVTQSLPPNPTAQDFCDACLKNNNINIKYYNIEHIPKTGPCIIVANHPLGGIFDGFSIFKSVSIKRKDIKIVTITYYLNFINLLEKNVFVLDNWDIIKEKSKNFDIIRKIYKHLKNKGVIIIFPAGKQSVLTSHSLLNIKDQQWNKNLIRFSLENKATIVPCFIKGKNKFWIYWIPLLGKLFELLLNAFVVLAYKNKTIELYFDKPLTPKFLKQFENPQHAINYIYELVYKIVDKSKTSS